MSKLPAAPQRALWQTFLVFLGPMILSNILQALSGTINNIYIGQMLGVRAMAAVASFFPILFFFIAFIIGLSTGASVLIGQAWGARDLDKVKAVAGTTLCVALGLGIVVALFGGALAEGLLGMLGTPADIRIDAIRYAHVMLIATPPLFIFLVATGMLRAVSDTVTPLIALILSTAIGLALTPALIRGWGGLPMLGITSAAWATLVSMTAASAWLAWYLRRRKHPLAPDAQLLRHLRIDRTLLKSVLRLGLPTGLFMVTGSVADLILLSVVNGFGSNATAAWGAIGQISSYVLFPAMSIAITASILAAQAIGAGRTHQLGAIVRTGLWMNLAITGTLVVLAWLFARHVISLFITDGEVVDLAQGLLRITVWSSLVFGMASVFSGVMRASGTVLAPTAISLGCMIVLLAPLGWALSRQFGLPGVWVSYPITYLCALAMQAAYFQAVWRKRPIRKLV
jgi:putative MATE family efflux protein